MPSGFDDTRLDEEIERGSLGGPQFLTANVRLRSGHRKATSLWTEPLAQWDVTYGIRELDDQGAISGFTKLLAFFYARQGSARSFRFKDWFDYQVTDEPFGTGDAAETVFQLKKLYTDAGGFQFPKNITKIVSTPSIYVDGALQTITTHYTIDLTTGIVTFVSPPGSGLALTWTGEHDKHVSFLTDKLTFSYDVVNAGSIPSIMIIEERD